jgi:hypothetical protein
MVPPGAAAPHRQVFAFGIALFANEHWLQAAYLLAISC